MDDTNLITTDVAAERLGRSTVYILHLLKQGDLEGHLVGPPRRGRPAAAAPSASTLAKRKSRAKQTT